MLLMVAYNVTVVIRILYTVINHDPEENVMTTRLLRLEEVSQRTGVPPSTLRYWRHRGIGPLSTKLGARVVYRESDVEEWLERRFAEAVGDPR